MKKTIILILLTVLLVGCTNKRGTTVIYDGAGAVPLSGGSGMGRLVDFSYSFGSYFMGDWSYHIYEEGGKVFIAAEGFNGVQLDTIAEVPEGTLGEIMKIIDDYDIMSWNGFAKYDKNTPDGYGFGLAAEYERGSLTASGYLRYPRKYESGHEALAEYLEKLAASTTVYIPAADDSVENFFIYLDSGAGSMQQTTFYVYFDTNSANYYHGDTTKRASFGSLPEGTMKPQELSKLMLEYYTLHPLGISDLNEAESENKFTMKVNDGLHTHTVYASGDADSEAFGEIVGVLLSYFDLDASFLGSEEHMLEGWRAQFSNPVYMIYDRNQFVDIIINLPERTVKRYGLEYTIDKETAEKFNKAMQGPPGWAFFRFLYQDYGIFMTDGRGTVENGADPIDVYASYDKGEYVWMWGSTRKSGDWLQLYGGAEYCEEWDYVVKAVDALWFDIKHPGWRTGDFTQIA